MPTVPPVNTQTQTVAKELPESIRTLISTITKSIPSVVSSIGAPNNNLQNTFNAMTINYDNASTKLTIAEENYIKSLPEGSRKYDALVNERVTSELIHVGDALLDDYKNKMNFIDQIAKQFKSEISSALNARMGYENLLIENAVLTKKLDAYYKILNTNERKMVYELDNMKNLYLYRRVIFFIYYLLIASYILFGDFITKKLYTDYTYLAILLIAVIFPLMLNTIISWTIICINAFHYWLDDSILKDVYDELDKTI